MAADERPRDRSLTVAVGLAITGLVLVVYVASNLTRPNIYNHFVWQASSWLSGEATIPYPVYSVDGAPGNDYFNDVMAVQDASGQPTGRGLLPFPPLPAVILLPFVAAFGLATNAQLLATVLGAFDVGIAFWMLGRLGLVLGARVAVTVFFGLGTVFWFTAEKGTTWYFAHVVAVGLAMIAVGLALDGDRRAVDEAFANEAPMSQPDRHDRFTGDSDRSERLAATGRRWSRIVDLKQFLAGLLFGLACTSRLTVVFGAPFFAFVGGGGSWWRRALSAGLGMIVPLGVFAAYNLVSTGHLFNPAYDFLYQQEAVGYSFLGYNPSWSILDLRYVPQNLGLMLVGPPDVAPTTLDFGAQLCTASGAVRGWFDESCPIIAPKTVGMGLLLTSPAYLLGLPALAGHGRARLVTGSVIALLFIAIVNLMHFSQGWVQFGYRFSLDFAPFALILVAIGLRRLLVRWPGRTLVLGGVLIALSVAVNLWGVLWASLYGW